MHLPETIFFEKRNERQKPTSNDVHDSDTDMLSHDLLTFKSDHPYVVHSYHKAIPLIKILVLDSGLDQILLDCGALIQFKQKEDLLIKAHPKFPKNMSVKVFGKITPKIN